MRVLFGRQKTSPFVDVVFCGVFGQTMAWAVPLEEWPTMEEWCRERVQFLYGGAPGSDLREWGPSSRRIKGERNECQLP